MITNDLFHKLLDESPDPVKFSAFREGNGVTGFKLTYSSWMAFTSACRTLGDAGWSGAPVVFEAELLVLSYYKAEQKYLDGILIHTQHKMIMGYREPETTGV